MDKKILRSMWALLLMVVLIFMPLSSITQVYAYESTGEATVQGNCVDISSNNGTVDFDSLVDNGVTKVIIRLGYGSDVESQDDSQFERNVSECERLGLEYGIYLYSYALDYSDLNSEIDHALRLASECNPTLGVWFDMEDADGYKSRNGIDVYQSGNMLTDFCIMFICAMRDNGYTTGIYANYNYFTNVLNLSRLQATDGFNMWLAHWGISEPSLDCKIWQFGDYGLTKAFDGNIYYGDYETEITDASEVDYSEIYSAEIGTTINTYYQVKVNGSWLPIVTNDSDYAGIWGQAITDVAISVSYGYAEYRVHTLNGQWLSWIDTRNTDTSDYYNGYAGNGTAIDAIQIYYHTPSGQTAQWACYCTSSPDKTGYYSNQWDTSTDSGMDGYAGVFGKVMDALIITVQERN